MNKLIKTGLLLLALGVVITLSARFLDSWAYTNETVSVVDAVGFPHDEVVTVSMNIEANAYSYMIENAMFESYVTADVTYNGYTFNDIAVRPKGNSSLKSVAQDNTSDRYSFKIDFNYYVDGQSFFGLTKLNLNNVFGDASYMREYLAYEAMDDLGVESPRTTYVALYINDAYFGLYLAVEDVNDSFLYSHFDDAAGVLYKPDMGVGADLVYVDDLEESYPGIYPENATNATNSDIIQMMQVFDEKGDVASVFDVDTFLKYLAVSTFTVHLDSYQGGMYHNYYLYNNNGYFTFIPWDLNMIFNGFPAMDDTEAVQFLIDEPVIGDMTNYPLVHVLLSDDAYMAKYHQYLEMLMAGYFEQTRFEKRVDEVFNMIKSYVETDPTSFYTYEAFEAKVYTGNATEMGILDFVNKRSISVKQQLAGEIPSTNDGMGNVSYRGFNVGNRFGNVGAKGFDSEGNPREIMDIMLPANPGNMTDMNAGERPEGQEGIDGVAPTEGFQAQLFEALLAMDNLPDDIATYVREGLLPPKEMLDQFLLEQGLTVDDLLKQQVMNQPQLQPNQERPNNNTPDQVINTPQQPVVTGSNTENAQYVVIGILLVATLGLTFGISKIKR